MSVVSRSGWSRRRRRPRHRAAPSWWRTWPRPVAARPSDYPRDIAFAGTVAATLRNAGDAPSALAVEQLAREAQHW